MTDGQSHSRWPEDDQHVEAVEDPGVWKLVLLYGLPLLILLVVPTVAWVGLFPGAIALRWTSHPPHRRRLIVLYVVAGLISVLPWIALIVSGDITELTG